MRDTRVVVQVTEEQKALWKEGARITQLSLSEFVRTTMDQISLGLKNINIPEDKVPVIGELSAMSVEEQVYKNMDSIVQKYGYLKSTVQKCGFERTKIWTALYKNMDWTVQKY